MKYCLSVDKGFVYKNDNRFLNIKLNSLKDGLDRNNNLKDLCQFTMLFDSADELKAYLISKKLLSSKYKPFDLRITYNYKDRTYYLSLPYSLDKKYFDYSYLEEFLLSKKKDFEFLDLFLKSIRINASLPEEFYLLKEYVTMGFSKEPYETLISNFLTEYCYKKRVLSYHRLYDLAMTTSRLNSWDLQAKNKENSSEMESLGKEAKEENSDELDQLKLF